MALQPYQREQPGQDPEMPKAIIPPKEFKEYKEPRPAQEAVEPLEPKESKAPLEFKIPIT